MYLIIRQVRQATRQTKKMMFIKIVLLLLLTMQLCWACSCYDTSNAEKISIAPLILRGTIASIREDSLYDIPIQWYQLSNVEYAKSRCGLFNTTITFYTEQSTAMCGKPLDATQQEWTPALLFTSCVEPLHLELCAQVQPEMTWHDMEQHLNRVEFVVSSSAITWQNIACLILVCLCYSLLLV